MTKKSSSSREVIQDLRKTVRHALRLLLRLSKLDGMGMLPKSFDVDTFIDSCAPLDIRPGKRGKKARVKIPTLLERAARTGHQTYTNTSPAKQCRNLKTERAALLSIWDGSRQHVRDQKNWNQKLFVTTFVEYDWKSQTGRMPTLRERNGEEFRARVRHLQNELSKAKREARETSKHQDTGDHTKGS